jgi:hypothetical protein
MLTTPAAFASAAAHDQSQKLPAAAEAPSAAGICNAAAPLTSPLLVHGGGSHDVNWQGKKSCWRCGGCVEEKRVRKHGKCSAEGEQKYQCLDCANVLTQLKGSHGTWPPATLACQSEDDQQLFYKKMQKLLGTNAKHKIAQASVEYLERHRQEARYYQDGGEFLPLSVWETRGFSVPAIVANSASADKAKHPVLGDVYRVAIVSSGQRGEDGWTRKQADNTGASGSAGSRKRARSSSSVSARSGERRSKKRQRKAEAEETRRAKDEESRRKEKDKEDKKRTKAAEQIVEKLMAPVAEVRASLRQTEAQHVPKRIMRNAKAALDSVVDALEQAQLVVERPREELQISASEAAKLLAAAQKQAKQVAKLAATIQNMADDNGSDIDR